MQRVDNEIKNKGTALMQVDVAGEDSMNEEERWRNDVVYSE